MRHNRVARHFWFAAFLLTIVAAVLFRNVTATSGTQQSPHQAGAFKGQV